MFNLIKTTPIADMTPLGNGRFKGEARDGNRTLKFVITMTSKGQVFVNEAVFRVRRQAVA